MHPSDEERLRTADQFIEELRRSIHHGFSDIETARKLLRTILRDQMWIDRIINMTDRKQHYAEFVRFVTDPPVEGLDTTIETLETLAHGDVELEDLLTQATKRSIGANQHNEGLYNIQTLPDAPSGTSRAAALRRLSKDRPDLHARVVAKELSANAAMIEAGFRDPTITIPANVDGAARALARRFTPEDLHRLVELLAERIAVDV